MVTTGTDRRQRGTHDAAPLRIDGSRVIWDAVEEWMARELTDDTFEDHFVDDVIVRDIGEGADGWTFDGGSYSVELRCHPRPGDPPGPGGDGEGGDGVVDAVLQVDVVRTSRDPLSVHLRRGRPPQARRTPSGCFCVF
ncbi:hypothetical protein ACIP4S_20975 [Streptomyces chartreusis]|uniref:hypothetical protein n=1 Tax=Streptomyces chartreusis TaxID=1969 RepID=UPI00382B5DB3